MILYVGIFVIDFEKSIDRRNNISKV